MKTHYSFQEGYVSAQKRFIMICLLTAVSVISILACQAVSNIISPVTSIPPHKTPQLISSYDGDWQGTTSQNRKVTFTVTHGAVITMTIQSTLIGASCISAPAFFVKIFIEPTALATGDFTPSYPVENGTFTITDFSGDLGRTAYTLKGSFSSPNTASGTFEYLATGTKCDGTILVDWTAEKIVR